MPGFFHRAERMRHLAYPYPLSIILYHLGALAGVLYIGWTGWQGHWHSAQKGERTSYDT